MGNRLPRSLRKAAIKTVLIDVPVHPEALAALRAMPGIEVRLVDTPKEELRPLPAALLDGVNLLFCTFPPANFEDLRALEFIQIASAGYSQLFNFDLPAKGIRAANGRGNFDVPIGEWNLAMMVALARDLRGMFRNQEARVWDRSAVYQREIRGSTVGLWGYGGTARETARLAKAFGLKVHVLSRAPIGPRLGVYVVPGTGDPEGVFPDRRFGPGQELEFLSGLDFLIVAVPLTPATTGLIGERELQALPRHACLLNPARGPIVQEAALLRALREGWIRAAALDTHYYYPLPPDHPLWALPNVIVTPHIAGSSLSPRFLDRIWDILLDNVGRIDRDEPLLNELTPDQLRGN